MARYADIEKIEKLLVQGIDENGDAIVSLRDKSRKPNRKRDVG